MQSIKSCLVIIFIVFNLLACNNELDAQIYSERGISLTIPKMWKLVKDGDYLGDRTISFSTGEFSGVSLTIFLKNEENSTQKGILFPGAIADYDKIDRAAYVERRAIKLYTTLSQSHYAETRIPISRPPFIGELVTISYRKSTGLQDMEIESYLLKI